MAKECVVGDDEMGVHGVVVVLVLLEKLVGECDGVPWLLDD